MVATAERTFALKNLQGRPILKYFQGEPRPVQREVLELLQDKWDSYDVFVLILPVATGKSKISMALADWVYFADVLTPTNILLEQYNRDFPKFPALFRRDLYSCCREHKHGSNILPHRDCRYAKVRRQLMAVPRGLMNYYMYMSLRMGKRNMADTLVIDEAHNVLKLLQEINSRTMWQHRHFYPDWVRDAASFLKWAKDRKSITTLEASEKEDMEFIIQQLESGRPRYVFHRTAKDWLKCKEPELRDCIEWLPVDISNPPQRLWSRDQQKLVLLSATFSKKDIEALGLQKKRVCVVQGKSPIPAENRPVIIDPVLSLNYGNIDEGTQKIAEHIETVYLPRHEGEKGVIHCTYKMSRILQRWLGDNPRFIFHSKEDKFQKYTEFLESPPEQGKVLVACGLYEGIDLPEDLGRWQVVAKVPWLSLADPAIKWKASEDKEWYDWETLKIVIQATGRVCRTPTDRGLTYIVDGSIIPLYERNKKQLPEWFTEAVKLEEN